MASVHALTHARPVCPPGRDEGSREAAAFFSACLVGEGRQWCDGIRGLESAAILHGGAHREKSPPDFPGAVQLRSGEAPLSGWREVIVVPHEPQFSS